MSEASEEGTETMTMITKATPLASLQGRRATKQEIESFTDTKLLQRTCMHCRTTYRSGGDAYLCEHFHEGLLGL